MKREQNRVFCFITTLLVSLLIVSASYAGSAGNLYESSVKVTEGKGESELIAEAFTHVLIKVSGRSDISALPAYKNMLGKAKSAISQFRYDFKTPPADNISQEAVEPQQEPQQEIEKEKWFWVRFNVKNINNILKEAQLPVWGKVRPETLIWFSQEDKGQRQLKSQHDEPEVYDIFEQQADYRGISLIFPFLDLQDQSSISATDIWGNFNDAILLASRRYQAQTTVTVRLFKERSGLWVSQWNLLMLGEVQSWELRDENKARILASGIDELADKLARQFTQVDTEGNDSGVIVQVNNVSGFKAFQELDDYVNNLATVKSATLVKMEQDRVIYNISYLGDKNALIQEIRLGDMLNSVERSQVDYGRSDSGDYNRASEYQPVILDGLDKKAQNSMAAGNSAPQNQTLPSNTGVDKQSNDQTATKTGPSTPQQAPTQEPLVQKQVERLIPELEYWLAR